MKERSDKLVMVVHKGQIERAQRVIGDYLADVFTHNSEPRIVTIEAGRVVKDDQT